MAEVFLKVLNMGIAADFLALAVLLSRALLRRAPRWTACAGTSISTRRTCAAPMAWCSCWVTCWC